MGPGDARPLAGALRATARLEVSRRAGRDVLSDVRSEPPFALRTTPDRILVVGSSAAPVGGDDLWLDVVVGAGARAAVGTAAATVVWPGRVDRDGRSPWSSLTTTLSVAAHGHLDWRPEPTVVVAGSRHRSSTTLALDPSASAVVVEESSLGRSGESSGRLDQALRVTRGDDLLVHHVERLGPDRPGWGSVALVGGARHVVARLEVRPGAAADAIAPRVGVRDGLLPGTAVAGLVLADDAVLTLAVAPDRPTAWRAIAGR